MDNARTTSNRLRTENQELKTETKELKKNLVRWKTCSIPNNWGFKASFPKHIKSYGRGERPTQANHQKQRFRWVCNSPLPPKGSDQTAASLNGVLRRSGSEEILQGSKTVVCLFEKSLWWCGRSSGRVVLPLPLGAPDRWFLSSWLYAVFRV